MSPVRPQARTEGAAWVVCPGQCGDFWCRIHETHAHECSCPAIEEWAIDPYSLGYLGAP